MAHHGNWNGGEMITRLDEDVEGLYNYFYMLIFKLVGSTLLMIGILIVLAMKIRFKESLPAGMMYSKLWSVLTILD